MQREIDFFQDQSGKGLPSSDLPENDFQTGVTHAELMREAPTDIEDQIWATHQLTWRETPVGAFSRINARQEADESGGPKLTPEELQKEFPDAPGLFKEPMNKRAAQFIYDSAQERQKLEDIIARGPQSGAAWWAQMGTGILTHLADPLEFTLNVATLGASSALGISAAAARVAVPMAARAGISAGVASTAAGIAVNLGENLAAAVVTEGINYQASKADAAPWSAQDALKNVVTSTLAFEGLFGAARLAKYGYSKIAGREARFVERLSPRVQEHIAQTVRSQLDLGKDVNVQPLLRGLVKETAGDGSHLHRPITSTQDLASRKFYAATEAATPNFADAEPVYFGDDFGGAVTLVEDPTAANGAAAREINDFDGSVYEMQVGELNLIDLDAPLAPEVGAIIQNEIPGAVTDGRSGKQVLEAIRGREELGDLPEGTLDSLNSTLEGAGYAGYRHDGSRMLGEDHPPRNTLVLFNRESATQKSARSPDRGAVPSLSETERTDAIESMYGRDAAREIHREADAVLDENLRNPRSETITPEELDKEFQDVMEEIQALSKQEGLDEADLNFIEGIKELEKKQGRKEEAFRQLSVCYGKAL